MILVDNSEESKSLLKYFEKQKNNKKINQIKITEKTISTIN